MYSLASWLNSVMQLLTEGSGPLRDPRKLSQLSGVVVGGEPSVAHRVQFLQRKLRPREGQGLLPPPSRGQPPCTSHLQAGDWKRQKEKGSVPGFLEAGGSFKAGACCQSDFVSMEAASGPACSCQPEAWWSPDRLPELASSLGGGGPRSLEPC